jgi:hypothetical protein
MYHHAAGKGLFLPAQKPEKAAMPGLTLRAAFRMLRPDATNVKKAAWLDGDRAGASGDIIPAP